MELDKAGLREAAFGNRSEASRPRCGECPAPCADADTKSDSNGKENKDAIVNVFLKVFNDMQGFCGSMPHLADLERRLSEEGRFEEFKETFEEEYGDPWESSRQDFDFIQDSVVDVLSDMDFMSESAARNWCEKAKIGRASCRERV